MIAPPYQPSREVLALILKLRDLHELMEYMRRLMLIGAGAGFLYLVIAIISAVTRSPNLHFFCLALVIFAIGTTSAAHSKMKRTVREAKRTADQLFALVPPHARVAVARLLSPISVQDLPPDA